MVLWEAIIPSAPNMLLYTSCGFCWSRELDLDCEPNLKAQSGSVLNLNHRSEAAFDCSEDANLILGNRIFW